MQRKYAAFYHRPLNTWMVIFKDPYEDEWYLEVPDAGGEHNAKRMAEALNQP